MTERASILLVDDEAVMRDVIGELLREEGYEVQTAGSGEEALDQMDGGLYDVVLLDLMLPGMGGLATLERIRDVDPDAVVIMLTAFASIENAVQATRLGAFDFITKPFKNEELLLVIQNGLDKRSLQIENRRLKRTLKERSSFENIVGKSEPMQTVFDLIRNVGPSRSTVLITGESGTGKELVAKAIHSRSHRASGPFVPVNSGSIPSELLESELFGHVKGAFTGATSTKKGLFEVADGGTLFLDEVGTIPPQTQTKLLRVIQEREFRRVGGLDNIKVDVRILAATNSDLRAAVEAGEFRDDLYYRLNVITIPLPPLRERKDDIPLLIEAFMKRYCAENERDECDLSQAALRVLIEYHWPGNVRELENAIERSVVLAPPEGVIEPALLPRDLVESRGRMPTPLELTNSGAALKDLVRDFEKGLIVAALEKTNWNQKRAAELLKVNATTLNEKLKRLGVEIPNGRRVKV